MSIRLLTWEITGSTPLLQSNAHEMWKTPEVEDASKVSPSRSRKKTLRGTDTEAFKTSQKSLYINEQGQAYHPAQAFYKVLQDGCRNRKVGSTPALNYVTCAMRVPEFEFILCNPKTFKPLKGSEWVVDMRHGKNHNKEKQQGGVGIVCIRPKWRVWGGLLVMEVDIEYYRSKKSDTVKEMVATAGESITYLLDVAGRMFGIGAGRRRLVAIINRREEWSDMGMGRFSAKFRG